MPRIATIPCRAPTTAARASRCCSRSRSCCTARAPPVGRGPGVPRRRGPGQRERSREEFCLGSRAYAASLRELAAIAARPPRSCSTWWATAISASIPRSSRAQRAANLVALVLEAARATGARALPRRTAVRRDRRPRAAARRRHSGGGHHRLRLRGLAHAPRPAGPGLGREPRRGGARRRLAGLPEPAGPLARREATRTRRAAARWERPAADRRALPAGLFGPAGECALADLPSLLYCAGQEWGRCDHSVFCLCREPNWKSEKKFASWPGRWPRRTGSSWWTSNCPSRDGIESIRVLLDKPGGDHGRRLRAFQPAARGLSRHESDHAGRLPARGELAGARAAADGRSRRSRGSRASARQRDAARAARRAAELRRRAAGSGWATRRACAPTEGEEHWFEWAEVRSARLVVDPWERGPEVGAAVTPTRGGRR